MNGWDTDAYLMAMTFPEGADCSNPENMKRLFIASGSFLRHNGKTLIHSLSKFFAVVDFEGNNRSLQFQGQKDAKITLSATQKTASIILNGEKIKVDFDAGMKILEFRNNGLNR